MHPSKTGEKLVYYYLYYVEESLPMDVCTHPFNITVIIICKKIIYSYLSLSSQYHMTIQDKILVSLHRSYD